MSIVGVTGAGGFIGSHLVSALSNTETVVDFRHHSSSQIDAIVHCAASHADSCLAQSVKSNIELTIDTVRAAQASSARTFIYLSSVSVNGDIEKEVNPDSSIVNPGVYGISKYLGEVAVNAAPFRTMSIRSCGVIGRGAHRNWLSRVLGAAKEGSEIEVSNPYSPFNNAVHVGDLCAFIRSLILNLDWSGHQTVTIGASGLSTPLAVVSQIVERMGRRAGIRLINSAKPSFTINNDAAIRFGYRPGNITEIVNRYVEESLV